jgi:hypothetical protein
VYAYYAITHGLRFINSSSKSLQKAQNAVCLRFTRRCYVTSLGQKDLRRLADDGPLSEWLISGECSTSLNQQTYDGKRCKHDRNGHDQNGDASAPAIKGIRSEKLNNYGKF